MKHLILPAMMLLMASCSSTDTTSYCPTWKGFTIKKGTTADNLTTISPRNISLSAGDYIQITACQDQKGHLINATTYEWIICCDTLDDNGNAHHVQLYTTKRTNYDGYTDGADDPVFTKQIHARIKSTETGEQDTIKFVAKYSYSGQGVQVENGGIVSNTSYGGRITPQSGSMSGGASGYLYFTVE